MNIVQDLINSFQQFVGQVPEIIQPFIVMLAGMIPTIEGDIGAMIGIVSGLNPIVAGLAAAVGNFVSVLFVVQLTSQARTAVVSRRAARAKSLVGASGVSASVDAETDDIASAPAATESKGRQKFRRWLVRYGVPGATIIGPLAIPTHAIAAILVAGGTARSWVLLWQAVTIALWTALTSLSAWAALTFLIGV